MNVLDLFSGIGGFSLGLERAGMRTVAFCERDEYCRAVLRKHWPDVPCFDDIHTLDSDRLGGLGRIDLVCGGFPCQPFSVAGKQKAQADDRHLWPEMRRVIALTRPAWVIGENVTGLVTLGLDDVLADLEGLGYTPRTFVIPAAAVGAPHRRNRLWIIATNTDCSGIREQPRWGDGTYRQSSVQPPNDGEAQYVADTDGFIGDKRWPSYTESGPQRRNSHRGSERQNVSNTNHPSQHDVAVDAEMAWSPQSAARQSEWWSAEPDVGRVAHGIPRRVDRLRCLGNAVVPQIVEEIGRAIMLSR